MKHHTHHKDARSLASVYALHPLAGERSWSYVMDRVGRALQGHGYHVRRAEEDRVRDDLESSLLTLCGMVGRVIAETGAKIKTIDCFEHAHTPGRVWIITELSSGHLHGVTIPLINPAPWRSPVVEDAGPVFMLTAQN
ncbi:hypothetical protein [Paraburkholderia flagellata]|uniref:hypothetical protein n=1 Tax=Paraburkholderia flagellata TaxID=2883241 RepID=UPI001F2291E1|nr:hypothetical protein [Paraburkholderia flagellata]